MTVWRGRAPRLATLLAALLVATLGDFRDRRPMRVVLKALPVCARPLVSYRRPT